MIKYKYILKFTNNFKILISNRDFVFFYYKIGSIVAMLLPVEKLMLIGKYFYFSQIKFIAMLYLNINYWSDFVEKNVGNFLNYRTKIFSKMHKMKNSKKKTIINLHMAIAWKL